MKMMIEEIGKAFLRRLVRNIHNFYKLYYLIIVLNNCPYFLLITQVINKLKKKIGKLFIATTQAYVEWFFILKREMHIIRSSNNE